MLGPKKGVGGVTLNEFLQNRIKYMQDATMNKTMGGSPLGTLDTNILHSHMIRSVDSLMTESGSTVPEVAGKTNEQGINNVIKIEVMAKNLAGINIKNPCANTFATCYLQDLNLPRTYTNMQ
ncbi:hypothetical protein ACET3Z_008219 [Daucus carota]